MSKTDNQREKTFSLQDAVFIGLYLAGAALCLFLFWRDLNSSLARLNEKPVGLITWKYRAAQRRYAERILWERLKTESPVYNGDIIRTAAVSEATVSLFGEGGTIALGENTLIRIQVDERGTMIDLAEGRLSVSAGSGGLRIAGGDAGGNTSGGLWVDAAPGTLAAITAPEAGRTGDLAVEVLEGSAGIQGGGEARTLTAGEAYSTSGVPAARVLVLSPEPQAKFLNSGGGLLESAFQWNHMGLAGDERVRLEVAEDRNFTRIIESRESAGEEERLRLANGVYYWRAYPSSAEGAEAGVGGKLSIVDALPPTLYSPAQGERFRSRTSRPGIRFQWQAREGAAAYLLEVSSSPGLEDPLFSASVQPAGGDRVSIVRSGLSGGSYYWRVTPVYPGGYAGRAQSSAISSFVIEETVLLAAPQTHERVGTVYLEAPQPNTYFTWEQERDAVYYTFVLSRQEDLGNPLVSERERDNYSVLNAREAELPPGRYYWGVYQTDMEGNNSALSPARTFVVMAGAPPEESTESAAPPVISTPREPPPEPPPAATAVPAPEPPPASATTATTPTRAPAPRDPAPPATPPATPVPAPREPPPPRATPPATPAPAPREPAPEPPVTATPAPVPREPPPEPPAATTPPPVTPAPVPREPPAPPRPLPAPRNLRPAAGYTLTEEIILQDRRIVFSWDRVSGATGYTFILYQVERGTNREILRQTALRVPSYTLTNLTLLDAGEFVWQVEAESGNVEQESEAATNWFRVNLGEIRAPESRESGVLFGRE
jgi:hypothetical protein